MLFCDEDEQSFNKRIMVKSQNKLFSVEVLSNVGVDMLSAKRFILSVLSLQQIKLIFGILLFTLEFSFVSSSLYKWP